MLQCVQGAALASPHNTLSLTYRYLLLLSHMYANTIQHPGLVSYARAFGFVYLLWWETRRLICGSVCTHVGVFFNGRP